MRINKWNMKTPTEKILAIIFFSFKSLYIISFQDDEAKYDSN